MNPQIHISRDHIASFCRERGVRRLAVFGSALRSDFGPHSDVDLLVEFDPDNIPGLLGMARMERELSNFFGDRKIDLRTLEDLSRYLPAEVLMEVEAIYDTKSE